MRKVTARSVLLSIGVSALVLVAASPPSLAKGAPARAHTETSKSAHFYYARDTPDHQIRTDVMQAEVTHAL